MLFCSGDGLYQLPIHRMCIINMALSDEAIINFLLHETMRVERKEFEGQKRSNENDIIRHRQKLAQEHVSTDMLSFYQTRLSKKRSRLENVTHVINK